MAKVIISAICSFLLCTASIFIALLCSFNLSAVDGAFMTALITTGVWFFIILAIFFMGLAIGIIAWRFC